ncbi:MAG: hypothetical protein JXR49_21470 [Acidobacteria bacterium]|nr:hypothetical protein [Acidobacteriota bacterium]
MPYSIGNAAGNPDPLLTGNYGINRISILSLLVASVFINGFGMNAEKPKNSLPVKPAQNSQSVHWISLFTGMAELQNNTMEHSREQLTEWWRYSVERISKQIPEFPEDFRTTRIWREIKFIENYLSRLKPVFAGLQAGTYNLNETVHHLRSVFSDEENRLTKWKQSLDNLQGLVLWLPAFSHAREYLLGAFPLGMEDSDSLCKSLIQSIKDPFPFLESGTRQRFDESFLTFKKNYIERYSSLHEEMRNVIRNVKKEESKVDPIALRNLELLSGLQYTDKSYLNRVNILARWIQRNQCTLPVSRILERYPRCYCNFNPCSIRQTSAPVNQINVIIQEGIEYFRTALRRCRNLIMKEVEEQKPDDSISKQIDTLLGKGTMIPIKAQTIDTLNRIIRQNTSYFQAKIRSRTDSTKESAPDS